MGKPVIPLGKPGSWNAKQVLPGGVVKVDDIYYMYFTGSNPDLLSDPPEGAKIGVAYSKDLIKWEYYSSNPALPGLGNNTRQFDNRWVGWPRMIVKNGIGYVFYTGGDGHSIGVRKIAIDKLTDWESDIDKTINLLKD